MINRICAVIIAVGLLFSQTPLVRADDPIEAQSSPILGGCPVFPADNIWNTPIDTLPVDPNSAAYIATIGGGTHPHADFGSGIWPPVTGGPIGIPFDIVPFTQTMVAIGPILYDDESDPGPYPIPANAKIEGGPSSTGDRHVLVLRQGECILYELYRAFLNNDGVTWRADSAAKFDLNSNALRPDTWTSADAAGLPILAGLARYEEVAAGEINHALRFTAPQTRDSYNWPARHEASSSNDPARPPMGQYFRLKSSFVVDNTFSAQGQVILRALQKYGMILADNGSSWYISGVPHPNWINDDLADDFNRVDGNDFEAVDVSSLQVEADSGQVLGFTVSATPGSQAIEAGESAGYLVQLTGSPNFSNVVTITTSTPGPSVTLHLSANSLTPSGNISLTLTDTHTSGPLLPGLWHTVQITASDNSLTRTAKVKLLVGGVRVYLPVILK